MEKEKTENRIVDVSMINLIRAELSLLDNDLVEVDGNQLKPSQCYRFELDPLHVLFNTNCPDHLREKVESILFKYVSADEDRAS